MKRRITLLETRWSHATSRLTRAYSFAPPACNLRRQQPPPATTSASQQVRPVRDPTTWTVTRHDGPNHLGL